MLEALRAARASTYSLRNKLRQNAVDRFQTDGGSMEIVIGIIVVAVVAGIWTGIQKQRALERAKKAYLEALAQLKGVPTNADLKQHTLALGRAYSHLTRDKKGVSLFDEVALMNDINAACAAAGVAHSQPPAQGNTGPSIEARLRTLTDLKDKGLVAPAEYESRRSEILSSI